MESMAKALLKRKIGTWKIFFPLLHRLKTHRTVSLFLSVSNLVPVMDKKGIWSFQLGQ